MYGTVARIRVKPGMQDQLMVVGREMGERKIPGSVTNYVYQMDADPNEYYLVVVFENKEAYFANANSPEQNAQFLRFSALLEGPPEWHDGEIVSGMGA